MCAQAAREVAGPAGGQLRWLQLNIWEDWKDGAAVLARSSDTHQGLAGSEVGKPPPVYKGCLENCAAGTF